MTTLAEALEKAERDLDDAHARYLQAKGRYEDCLRARDGLKLAMEQYGSAMAGSEEER